MNRSVITRAAALLAAGTIGGLATPLLAAAGSGFHTDYSDSGTFQPARNPARIYDSRDNGARLTAGEPVTIDIPIIPKNTLDSGGFATTQHIPARAVLVNLTAVGPDADGYLTAWTAGEPQPNVSNLNFHAGQDTTNLSVVYVTGGQIQLVASADTDVVVDLFGQFDQRSGGTSI